MVPFKFQIVEQIEAFFGDAPDYTMPIHTTNTITTIHHISIIIRDIGLARNGRSATERAKRCCADPPMADSATIHSDGVGDLALSVLISCVMT
jgi:hypothetical protein